MINEINLPEKVINIEKSELGLTNQNYIVTTENNTQFFVRIPYDHNHDLFDYGLEEQIHEKIKSKNINLPYISLDTKTGIKVSPYLENIKHLDELDLVTALPKIAEKLRKLHSLPKTNINFNTQQKYYQFKDLTTEPLYDLSEYEFILKELSNYPETVLCHNDLVNGNVISYQDEIYIIDYEYACDNHPYFDLLSLITENNIQDKKLRNLFYTSYFNHPIDKQLQHDLDVFESVHDLLWCQWAQMQHAQIKDPIYKEIANQKYEQLKKMVQIL